MAGNEPAYLPVGTDVSAKYRGAFCEAKVKKLVRAVKCKVILKETGTSVIVTDENVKGNLKVGATVEIKHPETGQLMEGAIGKLTDQSMYTVVFDDGDEKTLRRTQLCLKGEKHFIESETLDNLPLSHPEHFGTPVLQTKSRKRTAKTGSPGFNTLFLAQEDTDSEDSGSEDSSPKRASYRGRQQELVGKVMFTEGGDKRKGGINPVLVVLPDAASLDLKTKDHLLVKSFRDGKFLSVLKKELKDFTRDIAIKNEDKTLKTAIEKALLYFDNHELPGSWKRDELLGSDDEVDIDDDDSSDDEPSEEKDRFVAQLYKFMDDRGTPINKGPSIGNRDLNLYKLFRVVQNLGGYNRVTNQMKWRLVYSKMGLPQSNTASHQIKNAYKKFLHAFEDFYRKLGSTMGTISRPGRSRHSSGRSILSFRGREKDSPKSPRSVRPKESDKEDSDRGKSKSDGESHSEDGKEIDEESMAKEETPAVKDDTERKERTTPRRMLRDDLKEAKEKEKEAKKKKEEKEDPVKVKKDEKEEVKSKKDDKDEGKSKKEEKDEQKAKKEDKKIAEEERKSLRRDKQDDKTESKKDEVKSDRETRGQKDKQKDEGKVEKEKPKKKEKEKEEEKEDVKVEEEDKSGKKPRVTRRKSGRGEEGKKDVEEKVEEPEEKKIEEKKVEEKKTKKEDVAKVKKEDKKEVKKEEKKDLKKEEKKEDKEKKKEKEEKTKEKKINKEKKAQEEEDSEEIEEEETEEITLRPREEFPTGTKLKVRYGRGRNQKIYEAKVVEANKDGSHKTYLVHYAGWNNRYDEWVKPDRIISVVNKPDVTKLSSKKPSKTPSPKTVSNILKKRGRPPSGGSPVPPAGSASTEFRTPPPKSRSPAPGSGQCSKTRPTRSNSMENQVVEGLPPKRLTRRSSGITESSDTVSHASDMSSDEDSDETEQKIVVVVEEHKFDKDGEESDLKESEHDTSLEEEVLEDEHDTSIEEKDTDVSHDGEPDVTPVEEDSLLHCPEEMIRSEEEDMDLSEERLTPQLEPEVEKKEEKVEEVAVVEEVKEDTVLPDEPKKDELIEKKEECEDKSLEKDAAPELVAEKPFKESVLKGFDGKIDSAAEEARFEASEALLQMPILHEVFKKMPEEPKEIVSEVKKLEVPQMPEIKKIEAEIPKKEKEVEKKERGRKPKKDFKEGKKLKAAEATVLESKPVEPHVMTPQEARMKAAMDLYDFQGFEEPEELVLRRDKKSDLLGRRLLTLERDMKADPLESGETEKKKVKKKVKKKTVIDDEAKKEAEIREWFGEVKKDAEKKESDVKKDSVKESAKGKGLKGEKCAKKETKKMKDTKVDSDPIDGSKEKKEKRPRSRSSSPVETCSKALKTEPVCASPKPSTSAETVSSVKEQPHQVDSIAELSMNTMLDNTPPTTPEHEVNEAECVPPLRIADGQADVKESVSAEQMAKLRSESPSVGEGSGSSCEGNENNSALPTSESSNDVELATVTMGKRKRDPLGQTPSKKKRVSKGGKGTEKKSKAVQGSDSDDNSSCKHSSPVHVPGPTSPMKMPESAQATSPRPPKYNFNLEEGKYLEGERRIAFLIEKMQEIRKIYMNLKQEVACIDRRRKRAKRKERENSQSSQVDCESS